VAINDTTFLSCFATGTTSNMGGGAVDFGGTTLRAERCCIRECKSKIATAIFWYRGSGSHSVSDTSLYLSQSSTSASDATLYLCESTNVNMSRLNFLSYSLHEASSR
jgi:hypothetical protein